MKIIEVKDLCFEYKDKEALKNVSFSVEEGEFVAILGHNGSGKSTLAKLIMGLLKAKSGEIIVNGISLDEKTIDQVRLDLGIVFQNPDNQFVGFNVKYDIAFGLENHQIEREEMNKLIDEYTKKVDMFEYKLREPQNLSGGQKQRVAIAGILAMNCDIIILDEATSMLDPEGTKDIIDLIKELHTNYNKTIISITHDLNFAQLSDNIIVLKEGKIICEGKPEDIFNERDILLSSNLDMPFSLKAYYEASKDSKLKDNKEVMDLLWQYHLKK